MALEKYLHNLRHLKGHVEELKNGTFAKGDQYLKDLVETRYRIIEWEHDMIYIMRERKFEGYENQDFSFDLSIPEKLDEYKFYQFNPEDFYTLVKVLAKLNFLTEISADLEPEAAVKQVKTLQVAILDFSVAIALFKTYYNVNEDFDNFIV